MKGFLTILTCILCQTTFGQFGIIADKDGFVNVRNSPGISNNIIDTLTNGQIVFCLEAEGEWRPIDYDLSRQNKSGYIHKSRVKFIEDFDKITYNNLTDSTITFKKDSIRLIVTKIKFTPKNNKLQYHKGDASKNEMSFLEKINGKEIWGTDGNVPKKQYGQFTLTLGKDKIRLQTDNLFEPNLDYTTVNIDTSNRTIYISAMNSDGAGGYAVLWIIENGKFKQRITTIPF
ncbi:MAG: SH3 domain-containing protein [Bacteroidales bacterium]|nr:SH3 domain-containing protein [Bacteroidales bacterium]